MVTCGSSALLILSQYMWTTIIVFSSLLLCAMWLSMVVISAFLYLGCTSGPLLFLSINVVVPFICSEIVLL